MTTINPAMMTFTEYCEVINPDGIHHPSSAYPTSLASLNEYRQESEYPQLINRFKVKGLEFKLREKQVDRWAMKYVAHDDEGEIKYDTDGNVVYLTMAEKAEKIPNRYRYEHAIIESQTDQIVGITSDDWGCLLICLAEEYRNFGLGERLHYHHRKQFPTRYSGGFTPNGEASVYRAYQRMVSEALRNGDYRHAYQSGEKSFAEIKGILKSARVVTKYVQAEKDFIEQQGYDPDIIKRYRRPHDFPSVDLNMRKPADWLLHYDNNFAVLYDKKIFPLIKGEQYEEFIDKGILGYVYVGGVYHADSTPKLFRQYAANDKIKAFLAELMLNQGVNEPIRVCAEDAEMLRNHLGEKVDVQHVPRTSWYEAKITVPTLENTKVMALMERRFRQANDQFDEVWTQIHERAYALGEEAHRLEQEKTDDSAFSL